MHHAAVITVIVLKNKEARVDQWFVIYRFIHSGFYRRRWLQAEVLRRSIRKSTQGPTARGESMRDANHFFTPTK